MNRFKFRTWDKHLKQFAEWTNRDPFFSTSHGQIFFWERTQKEDGSYDGDIILQDNGNRFVLQQFTGLQDRDGKDIYEGDIVSGICLNSGPQTCVVGFGTWGIFYTKVKFYPCDEWENVAMLCQTKNKVIGNIFENPELLKP